MSMLAKLGRVAVVALPVVLADQITKAAARAALGDGEVVEVLPFANLRLGFNRGISFGFAQADEGSGVLALVAHTGAICLALVVWADRTPDVRERLALSLILGSAAGNLVDRVRDGMVTDFIDLHAAGYHWPTFNLADIAISLSAAFLVLAPLRAGSGRRREAA